MNARPIFSFSRTHSEASAASAKAYQHAPLMDGEGTPIRIWVKIKGTTAFCHWAKHHAGFRKNRCGSGYILPFGCSFSQYERQKAAAEAYAKVLNSYGIEAKVYEHEEN